MFFYLLCILVFTLLYAIAERSGKIFFLFVAMVPPIIFEGLRYEYVGTDMNGYGTIWFYNMPLDYSVWQVVKNASTPEYGYHLLVYFSKKISNDIHFYMTICAFFKILMVYLTAWKLKSQINTTVFVLGYFLFFYVLGFSMMRQSIAIAFCLYSLTFLLDHKPIIFSILVLLAYFFHNSALFMYIWLPLSLIRKWKIRYSILIVTGLLFYFTLSMLMSYLVGSSLFKDDIAEKYMNSGVNTSKTMIVISISFLLYGVFLLTHNRFKNSTLLFLYVSSSTLSLIVIFMAYYIEVAFRVALYMIIASMILTLYHIQINKKSSWVLLSIYISLFLLDFYISCSHGLYGALDYSSKILGI